MPSPRTAARPGAAINSEALRPAIAAAGADRHLVGAILLPHALGAQHHGASPARIAPCGSTRDPTDGKLLLGPLPGYSVPVLA